MVKLFTQQKLSKDEQGRPIHPSFQKKKKKKVLEGVKEMATSKQVLCLSHSV